MSHGKCCTHLNVTRVIGEERNIINQRSQQGRKKSMQMRVTEQKFYSDSKDTDMGRKSLAVD